MQPDQILSLPSDAMKSRYDAIIIGSGYGAGVAAARLAQAGKSVAVLERGREIPTGQFPTTVKEGARNFQADTPLGHIGARDALFDLRAHADISVMVGCGLGGTSLINGNVMLEPEERVFEDPKWPSQLQQDRSTGLAEGYNKARSVLRPVSYPGTPELAKFAALETSAARLGTEASYPPINVTFDDQAGLNAAGVNQPACTLCGDCCSGCNVGAKNTIALTYLPLAHSAGAEIFTLCKAQRIEKGTGGAKWDVTLEDISEQGDGAIKRISADIVVSGAGTLGSTEVLLRSAKAGLELSDMVGQNFGGNGDVIAFGYNNDVPINGIGVGADPTRSKDPVGPVIAGLIDLRKAGPLNENIVIQEGAIPSLLAPILPAVYSASSPFFGKDTDRGDFLAESKRTLESLAHGAYRGAANNTQTYLVMAHDGGDGNIALDDEKLALHWPDAGKKPVFERIDAALREATSAVGGTYLPNPMWSDILGKNLISVHPLGGCVMGNTHEHGAVDHRCRVFDGAGSVHEGLYVMDGSVVPRSLGVNPALTITALAERAMALMIEEF
ncbi:MAG: GMC family oxidoreductase [Erythrobacter sp.]